MKITELTIKGVYVVESDVHADSRGYFFESYNERDFHKAGLDTAFAQDNISRSTKGALRGLHYQLEPYSQGKLVRVVQGEVFDVAVDIRKGSPAYGQWYGHILSAENKTALYISPGFAHGFLVLSDTAVFTYKCTRLYEPKADRCIVWNDAKIGIKWPIPPDQALMSGRDREAPPLEKAENNLVYK